MDLSTNQGADDRLVADPVATEATPSVDRGAPMPDVEPGHKGYELNPGEVFDPNAALRNAEGRGPGLQDSEIISPAHWVQPVGGVVVPGGAKGQLEALRREREMYERGGTDEQKDRLGQIDEQIRFYEQQLKDEQKAAGRPSSQTGPDPVTTKAKDKA
ncbi:MAG TPA: hypothetical protein VNT51_05825 [Miltoncostaeaceae bacterium]|nr:hypothetical protein [Miltoncostaeaceae bacterium]